MTTYLRSSLLLKSRYWIPEQCTNNCRTVNKLVNECNLPRIRHYKLTAPGTTDILLWLSDKTMMFLAFTISSGTLFKLLWLKSSVTRSFTLNKSEGRPESRRELWLALNTWCIKHNYYKNAPVLVHLVYIVNGTCRLLTLSDWILGKLPVWISTILFRAMVRTSYNVKQKSWQMFNFRTNIITNLENWSISSGNWFSCVRLRRSHLKFDISTIFSLNLPPWIENECNNFYIV